MLISKKQGFSLMEVMVALLLISMTMLMFGYFAKSLKITSSSRQETQAVTSLRSSMERLRSSWGTVDGFNRAELPRLIDAPQGYTKLTATVAPVSVGPLSVGSLSFSCEYTFEEARKKFEDNCSTSTTEDLDSLIRSINFTLESAQKEPLVLSMQIARPVN